MWIDEEISWVFFIFSMSVVLCCCLSFPCVYLSLLITPIHVALSSSTVVNDAWLWNVAPSTAYLNEHIPNICITVVDGNALKCTFSFIEFEEIRFKFAMYFQGIPVSVRKSDMNCCAFTKMLSSSSEYRIQFWEWIRFFFFFKCCYFFLMITDI